MNLSKVNHSFKIGDLVKLKNANEQLGFVSHVHMGNLFLLDDFEIRVHTGNKEHVIVKASELEGCVVNHE